MIDNRMNLQSFSMQLALAFIFSVTLIVWQAQGETPDARAGDSYAYLSVAKELVDTGRYTDGRYSSQSAIEGEAGQGMFFAPLYPALIAGSMILDQSFYDMAACHLEAEAPLECSDDFGFFRLVQMALAALSAFLVWLAGWVLTGRYSVAWLALILSLAAEAYAYYTAQIMTESLLFPIFTTACLSAAVAWKRKSAPWWLIAGLVLGCTALTRPSFVYLFYAALPVVIILGAMRKNIEWREWLKWPVLFLFGYLVATGPWMVRNGLAMGEYSISKGYASFILVQRVAYNDMSWQEWGASFVYGLPDFGDGLAKDIFPRESYERFDYANPEGFYIVGNDILRDQTIDEAGGIEHHLSWLLKHEVFGNIYKHVMVTFSLAWRGMWVSKYWGLIAVPIFLGVFLWAVRRKWMGLLIFSIPPWFMLGFHAFTSVNVVRYNLILIPALAIAVAFLLNRGIDRMNTYWVHRRAHGRK